MDSVLRRRIFFLGFGEKSMVVPTMDSLPRVPDTHGDTVDEKVFSDLYIRTSWFDASIALDQIEKVGDVDTY